MTRRDDFQTALRQAHVTVRCLRCNRPVVAIARDGSYLFNPYGCGHENAVFRATEDGEYVYAPEIRNALASRRPATVRLPPVHLHREIAHGPDAADTDASRGYADNAGNDESAD